MDDDECWNVHGSQDRAVVCILDVCDSDLQYSSLENQIVAYRFFLFILVQPSIVSTLHQSDFLIHINFTSRDTNLALLNLINLHKYLTLRYFLQNS